MTDEHRKILTRIHAYSEQVMGDIDPQKVQVSAQLEKLKPIMEEIAAEQNMALEDVFILYMDLQSEASAKAQDKFKEEFKDLSVDGESPLLFR